ncbi:MAG: Asp-tRNA(Asn)/Glu-tRNA(Gln) amidotransferase subunit GatC [Candidatus Bipolaricaulota bacterium]|nr:Asp-tRNA(Asn)/Glu-tRNA(Gln) amidotransferase subunit GatC [Candidatus Bipolaricaulota bacterium]MCX7843920.1 Asp-tRNA(Asn)/Glu-tRNA(Gln) amidotransferase subunit GatC [Candidatus Bipolaricaulota bacterium]MDW8151668.1 Asp-tRNA(Asn)/Glu-tRNA(Gln) amidotransferase subunit GatC [Candidatus Bipolaricaulota bacterium]
MIDEAVMAKVEALAGLRLSPEERERLRADLAKILAYFRKLQEVDTEGVPPFSPLPGQTNVLREDEPAPSLPREAALRHAPDPADGYFRVPPLFPS